MSLSPYRQHKIYIAAKMGYGLGSEDPEELDYYEIIKKEIEKKTKTLAFKELIKNTHQKSQKI